MLSNLISKEKNIQALRDVMAELERTKKYFYSHLSTFQENQRDVE